MLALAAVSCFGTPPGTTGGDDDDAPCIPGARLCPCDAGACDPGLTCAPSVDRCVSEDCDVGEIDCPCADAMQCEDDLVCIDSLCVGPQDTGSESPMTTTTDPSTTVMPMTTDAPGSDTELLTSGDTGSSGVEPATSGEVSTGTTGTVSECAFGECSQCITCAMADDGPCAAQADACDMDLMMMPPPCFNIWYELQMCESNASCTAPMCPMPSDMDGTALAECLEAECGALECKCV